MYRPLIVVAVCGLALLSVMSRPAGSQDSPPTFRTAVQQVAVQVTVTDSAGRRVVDLTRDDFEVFEDDLVQQINSFVVTESRTTGRSIPSRPAQSTTSPVGERNATGEALGHDYVLVLDPPRNPLTWQEDLLRMRNAALLFIASLRAEDRLVISTGSSLPTLDFSRDRADLARQINDFCDALAVVYATGRLPPDVAGQVRALARVREAALRLGELPTWRKAILFISRGSNLMWLDEPKSGPGPAPPIEASILYRRMLEDTVRMATLAGVPIHVLDQGGLQGAPFSSDALSPFVQDPQERLKQMQRARGVGDAQSSLRLIAEMTGGIAIVNTNRWEEHYAKVAEHQWPTYILGYMAPSSGHDARFHAIRVHVKRPGVKVRATPGYFAFPPGGTTEPAIIPPRALSAAAREALEQESAETGLTVRLQPARLVVPGRGGALIGVELSAGDRPLDTTAPIELVVAAFDGGGALRAIDRQVTRITVKRGDAPPAAVAAFRRLNVRGAVPYRFVAVAAQPGGAIGSTAVWTDARLDVEPMRFSDVLLASSRPDPRMVVLPDADVERALIGSPTFRRAFDRAETLAAHVEIAAQPDARLPGTIELRAALTSDRGEVRLRIVSSTKAPPPGGHIRYGAKLPLANVPPGPYQLTLEARGADGENIGSSAPVGLNVR